ncbi:MarR family transcriptional regulator [Clostridium baratii]|uniref:MarR family transcriptional regulator n=1 Tax=Clostridium baratii TaxID=1561 RepID=A0A174V308_9CLOT|nr:MarR family transcriptional regulator [Clostridium baratii]OPF52050.1 MarR family transcriptional regulator [Clostridium baratii]OPF56676.1 MarR family transcriptional regulator [Clostridium baratii]OPF57936.1 MarR family transcriptional regulator [Clostridium baratii]OPF58554.1 MarR family transcriptional regulator [Clostridium baratii]CUQ26420.1 MarR family transcriptional regulator [Clostridium baratii]
MKLDEEFSFHRLLGEVVRLHFSLSHSNLEKEGLYPGQPPLLCALHHHGGLSQKDIANKLNLKPATITVMIKRLEKSGFITKTPDEKDQRISRIYLTDKGNQACDSLKSIVNGIDNICLNNFSKEELENLRFLLNKVKINLENHKNEID